MTLYLDTSALVKFVQVEPETKALRSYLHDHPDDAVTSDLATVELMRAVAGSDRASENGRRVLEATARIPLTRDILDDAIELSPKILRTLDAIHLATALLVPDLTAVVTYDRRMIAAATEVLGLSIASPR